MAVLSIPAYLFVRPYPLLMPLSRFEVPSNLPTLIVLPYQPPSSSSLDDHYVHPIIYIFYYDSLAFRAAVLQIGGRVLLPTVLFLQPTIRQLDLRDGSSYLPFYQYLGITSYVPHLSLALPWPLRSSRFSYGKAIAPGTQVSGISLMFRSMTECS